MTAVTPQALAPRRSFGLWDRVANDARILAGGISEALITTETGLIIAIPILLLHGKLTENLDYITGELNIQSMSLLNRIWPEGKQENA